MTIALDRTSGVLVAAAAGRPADLSHAEPGPTDWRRLVTAAAWHRMVGLLWIHLRDQPGPDGAPTEVLAALKQASRGITATNLHLQSDLLRLGAELREAAIPTVALKGAALLDGVYEHPGMRPMSDLDLLVPAGDVSRAQAIVTAMGYTAHGNLLGVDEQQRLGSMHHHFPLVSAAGTVVELHHRLVFDRPGYDAAGVLRRARPARRPDSPLVPEQEDLFLHVAVHFATDRIRRMPHGLGQLADVVRVIDRCDLDWDVVVQRARDNAVADRLFLALDAVELLIGDVAPNEVLAQLRPDSYRADIGEMFVRSRVLAVAPSLPLEELSGGPIRRLVPPRQSLEKYMRASDKRPPSTLRLHGRRVGAVTKRLTNELPNPRRLVDDVRLSRWIIGLNR